MQSSEAYYLKSGGNSNIKMMLNALQETGCFAYMSRKRIQSMRSEVRDFQKRIPFYASTFKWKPLNESMPLFYPPTQYERSRVKKLKISDGIAIIFVVILMSFALAVKLLTAEWVIFSRRNIWHSIKHITHRMSVLFFRVLKYLNSIPGAIKDFIISKRSYPRVTPFYFFIPARKTQIR